MESICFQCRHKFDLMVCQERARKGEIVVCDNDSCDCVHMFNTSNEKNSVCRKCGHDDRLHSSVYLEKPENDKWIKNLCFKCDCEGA